MHPSATDLWLTLLGRLVDSRSIIAPRGQQTKELLFVHHQFDMNYPVCYHQHRRLNYAFSAAEAYFIAHGDNRTENLTQYNKNMAQFSDDGLIFNGAYGPPFNDQLMYVVNTLAQDLYSRQAVLTIWKQNPVASADIRCLAGDTIIHSPEGDRTLVDLESHFSDGLKSLPIYSFNTTTGNIEIDECIACWETGVKPILEIEFENGQKVKCTEDHIFYRKKVHKTNKHKLHGFSYIPEEAKAIDLKIGDRLYSTAFLNTLHSRKIIKGLLGKNWSHNNQIPEHKLYAEYLFGNLHKKHVHHIDHNPLNNKANNLIALESSEHLAYHCIERMRIPVTKDKQVIGNMRLRAKQNAIGMNVSNVKETGHDIFLEFSQDNSRKFGTRAYNLYEKYKKAKTLYEFLAFGGFWAELAQDINRNKCKMSTINENGILYQSILDQCFNIQRYESKGLDSNIGGKFTIVSIKRLPPEKVYDFATKKNHNAAINGGLITHNCTVALQFLIRDNRIHTKVTMRSSDIWLGVPYDLFNFTVMTLRVLTLLNKKLERRFAPIELGIMDFTAGSSHMYVQNEEDAKKVLAYLPDKHSIKVPNTCYTEWNYVVNSLVACMNKVENEPGAQYLWKIRP